MREVRYTVLAIIWLFTVGMAQGAELKQFAGMWVMRLGERNLFVLTLTLEGDEVKGTFERPAKLSSQSNSIFANMRGGIQRDSVIRSQLVSGVLHLTLPDMDDPKQEDEYVMSIEGDKAELIPDDTVAGYPYLFQRATVGTKVSTDWEPNRSYSVNDSDTPNTAMKAIFDEDQRVRLAKQIDWDAVNKADVARREQTRKLLSAGALHTGEDYENASFIFQHGHSSDDYLLAHTLAMVAVSKGDATAIWIAAATLDRYLQMIGQKQIYGTQFLSDSNKKFTQEPYARDTVSDALRLQLGVLSQPSQTKELKEFQSQK